jgi:pyruvate ferredoxin oxidoreductase gamma subunit
MALARLGKAGALSGSLGAVAARLLGLSAENLRAAIARELAYLGVSASVVEQNLMLAAECYEAVPIVPVSEAPPEPTHPADLWTPVYEAPTRGTARISSGANTPLRKTGDWRIFRPVLVPEKCNGCWLCFVYCPDAAISLTADDRPVIDYDHCKGCMLCVEECPTQALLSVRESEAGTR